MDCSNIFNYKKEITRMCDINDDGQGNCVDCPLMELKHDCCNVFDLTKECVDIVQKWSDEHPVKTRQCEFLKVFPNAETHDGIIKIFPCHVEKSLIEHCNGACRKCKEEFWLEEIE